MALGTTAVSMGFITPTGGDNVRDGDDAITNNALVAARELEALAQQLKNIASAYDVALENGYTGTAAEWLASLRGTQGKEGPYGGTAVTDPQIASYITTATATRAALLDAFLQRTATRSGVSGSQVLNIVDDNAGAGETIRIKDTPEHKGIMINLQHHAAAGSGNQTYAINIANHPGATSAFVIHQYSAATPAMQIDNTDVNAGIYIKNTENQTMNPGGYGAGSFLQLLPYGETGALQLTNGLTWLNNSTKDMQVHAVNPSIFGFGVRVDGDKTGLQVTKNGTGPGNAAWITNRGAGSALFVSQLGNAEAFRIYTEAVGKVAARIAGNDQGLVVTTAQDAGITFDVMKSGAGGGVVARIINRGTGPSLSILGNSAEVARIHNTGDLEIYTPGSGIFLRSDDGSRFKLYPRNDGTLAIAKV